MRRFIMLTFCVILMASLFCGPVKATTYSSDYLRTYDASLSTGSSSGLSLTFSARARYSMSSIGISRILVYSDDGSYVKTITGSTSNGLLASNMSSHEGTYAISATSGQKYYLEVTFTAKDSSGSDSKTLTTNTATAK